MNRHARCLAVASFVTSGILATSPVGAVPSDYSHQVIMGGPSAVRVRVVKKSTGQTVTDANIGLATVSMGPRGKPVSITTRILPVKDPKKPGDWIFKIEVGMVVHELQLTTKLSSEANPLVETVLVK